MIQSLQSLRFLFALMIFAHHLEIFDAGGSCGVSFFLILSGFVLSAGYGSRVSGEDFSWKSFMRKRWFRLYPLHFVCLLLALLLHGYWLHDLDFRTLPVLSNVLLLQSWFPWTGYFFSGNAVSWCLSDLMFFYALFPWLYRIITRPRYPRLLCALILLYLAVYGLTMACLPEMYGNQLLYIHPLFRLSDFIIGIFCYRIYAVQRIGKPESGISFRYTGLELLSVAIIVLACIAYDFLPLNMTYAFLFWLPTSLLILVFARGEHYGGLLSRFLSWKYWRRPAEISFSFYMVHQLGILFLESVTASWSRPLFYFSSLLLSLLLSWCVYYGLECPTARFLMKRWDNPYKK